MNLDLVTALLMALAAIAAGVREILLSPSHVAFPKAPLMVRGAIYIHLMALAGASVLFWGAAEQPGDYAGQGSIAVALFAFGMALYNLAMFINVMRQRYDPVVWRRINRMNEVVKASCPAPNTSWRRAVR